MELFKNPIKKNIVKTRFSKPTNKKKHRKLVRRALSNGEVLHYEGFSMCSDTWWGCKFIGE